MNEPTKTAKTKARVDSYPQHGRNRAAIETVAPEIDCGRFPIKRIVGDEVVVEADIFADGHDVVSAVVKYRKVGDKDWRESQFEPIVNDRWSATFTVEKLGRYEYRVVAWVDHLKSWRRDIQKKVDAAQHTMVDLRIGADLISEAAERAGADDRATLEGWAKEITEASDLGGASECALDDRRMLIALSYPDLRFATHYPLTLEVVVDRKRAEFSSWYELFPRSTGTDDVHGTFKDVEKLLPYVSGMGFDILYLPPIHPIGQSFRKGKNNVTESLPNDTGSPWAIGGKEGGHKSIHPDLGTLEEFRHLVTAAADAGLEIAMDAAFQTSPDHPYVSEHAEWYRKRPDGTIQYAENPPKKYQDIYPFEFEADDWHELWSELRGIFKFWIDQGIRIFRVDNPHTKPFVFWEWVINSLKADYPDLIFLSEAFTRPKVMYRLAKSGFTQSYTYFTWRNATWELEEYLREVTSPPVSDIFRPNLWPNTPDILSEYLQSGQRSAFVVRLILAATMGASYGIYGPAFELLEHTPIEPGREEYLSSEKYQIRAWDLDRSDSLRDLIARVNEIRHDNAELQTNRTLRFHHVDNPALIAYSKSDQRSGQTTLIVVNVDAYNEHSGWVSLDLEALGVDDAHPYQVHDLLTDERYTWNGNRAFVRLSPNDIPAHILKIRHHVRTEQDFDHFM
ncbi:MAG: alpha-1,4-glucan--maltose-1-phosphate maltosyltransferase [Nitrolancea sp.]